MKQVMDCGNVNASSAFDEKGNEVKVCVMHGLRCHIAEPQPDLYNRKSKCNHCSTVETSTPLLAYYKYKPECEFDEHFCGCAGWD